MFLKFWGFCLFKGSRAVVWTYIGRSGAITDIYIWKQKQTLVLFFSYFVECVYNLVTFRVSIWFGIHFQNVTVFSALISSLI